MKMNTRSVASLSSSLLLTVLGLSLAGCSSGSSNPLAPVQAAQAKNAGNFSNTVFLGDSLTAGYQSGSLLDTQQVHGWAPLVAKQARFNIVQPLIAYPGAPNVLQLVSVGPPPVITTAPGTTTGRDNFATQVTDLAVPGALLNDVINTVPLVNPAPGQQQLNQLVLGFPGLGYGQALSQLGLRHQRAADDDLPLDRQQRRADRRPYRYARQHDVGGNFTTQYQALITQLTTMTPAHLVIGNIPDVTQVPYLTPAALVLAATSQQTGLPTTVLSGLLGIVPGDYVNPTGTAQVPLILAGKQKGPITDAGVLSAAEVVTVQAQVTAFNQVIAQQAQAANATLVDINALFKQVTTSGLTINGYTGTARLFSAASSRSTEFTQPTRATRSWRISSSTR